MNLRKFVTFFVPLALLVVLTTIAQSTTALPAMAGPRVASAVAEQPVAPALEPAGPSDWSPDCTPVEVAVYESRLHIRCSQGVADGSATIYFWAMPATKTQYANRFLSLGSTALVAGRHLAFLYTPGDTSGTAFGCAANDCRNVYAVILK